MMLTDLEAQAFRLFEPKIRDMCKSGWRFMEYDDRLSEAAYIFLSALRTFPTNSGLFWEDYKASFVSHMERLKKEYGRQSCWISLDSHVRDKKNSVCRSTILDLIIAAEEDRTDMHVHRFMNALPMRQQDMLNLLMDRRSRRSVCKRMQLKSHELQQCLQEIAEDYRDYSMEEE